MQPNPLVHLDESIQKRRATRGCPPLIFLLACLCLQLLVHEDVSQETSDDEEHAAPCVPVLISQVAHERNECAENEKDCA